MSAKAHLARTMLAACASLCLVAPLGFTPVWAQAPSGAANPSGVMVQHIIVEGTSRVEPATVLSYITLREGAPYDERAVDQALKTLFATGLFADVKFRWNEPKQTLTIHVVENPIINQVEFEGYSKVSEKDLNKEIQLKPRTVFTRSKVQSDVERLIELYRRNGKFAATIDPQIIQRPQNRVDLIYSINEGPTTGVARINFIGNKVYDDDTLRGQVATRESAWWRFLSTNDNYDPDRLTFDREQIRRFYVTHGYADFRIVSAVAQLAPDRRNFYITFTIDEGDKYKFGKVEIESKVHELPPRVLRPSVKINSGDVYDAELIQKSIDALTSAAGTKGYAFAQIHPRIRRDHDKRVIDVIFNIDQGPRVYIEKINIVGNTRTLDKIIRREFRLVEGDAFNRALIDRSRTRLRGLGFFKNVDVKDTQGSQPDRTNLTVSVTEQSTGELSLGAGYSSTDSFVGQFSYTERNLFGRGQYLRGSISLSHYSKEFQASFTEPYFLDRPLAAGIDLYKVVTNFDQANYRGDTTAAGFRLGFPTSEYGSVGLRYTIKYDYVTPYAGAPIEVQDSAGSRTTSLVGYTYMYNTLDDPIKPTKGFTFSFSQDFAGLGGTQKYIRSELAFSAYKPILWDKVIASFTFSAGHIAGLSGKRVNINDRFFKGGDSFRGFKLAGIGPRDLAVYGNSGAIGGDAYGIGTISARLPSFLPEDYGITTSLFTDFGTLGQAKFVKPACTTIPSAMVPIPSCIKDNFALRASAGIGVAWKSPFGPIEIDLALPYAKAKYDKTEIIHFSAGTGL